MGRLMMCLSLLLLVFVQTQAVPALPSDFKFKVEEEILGLVRQMAEAQKNYDAAKLDEILAPDYVRISPAGEVDPRAKVLGFYAPEKKSARQGEMVSYELDEFTTTADTEHTEGHRGKPKAGCYCPGQVMRKSLSLC